MMRADLKTMSCELATYFSRRPYSHAPTRARVEWLIRGSNPVERDVVLIVRCVDYLLRTRRSIPLWPVGTNTEGD